jgi:hypothetical protein
MNKNRAQKARSITKRIGSLGSATSSVAISSALAFPVLLTQLGLSAWGDLAFAQALGLVIATLANWGYQGFGQSLVAAKPRDLQLSILFEATRLRAFVVTILFSICFVFLLVFKQENFFTLSACAGAYLLSGLSNIWYFQGTDTTSKAVWLEALPKIVAMWAAISALLLSGSFLVFSIAFLACSIISSVIPLLHLLGLQAVFRAITTCTQAVGSMKKTWTAASASATSLVYMAFPTVIIGVIAPTALPTYALLERLIRFASLGLSPITASIQSWVLLDQVGEKIEQTIRKAKYVILTYAVAVGFGFVATTHLLRLVFPDLSESLPLHFVLIAAATLSSSVSTQVLGAAFLGSQKNLKYQFAAAGFGALAWLALGPFAIAVIGGLGAQLALALSEVCVLVVQAYRVASIRRESRSAKGASGE